MEEGRGKCEQKKEIKSRRRKKRVRSKRRKALAARGGRCHDCSPFKAPPRALPPRNSPCPVLSALPTLSGGGNRAKKDQASCRKRRRAPSKKRRRVEIERKKIREPSEPSEQASER